MKYARYRVYPAHERARAYAYFERAVDFARDAWVRQGLGVDDPIQICIGSGSDFKIIGYYGPYGFVEATREVTHGR